MNNTMILKCENCGLSYCGECSEHSSWIHFCSEDCEKENEELKDKGYI